MSAIACASRLTLGRRAKILIATFVSLGLTSGATKAQDLLLEKALPLALVDRAGLVRALIRDDGAGPHTLDSSR